MSDLPAAVIRFAAVGAACLAAALVGCSSSFGPVDVVTQASALRILNSSDAPIYYFIVERQSAALVDWAPCTKPSTCPSVAAHGDAEVPFSRIVGYEPGEREAIFYWWHLLPVPAGGFQVDSIRTRVVQLRQPL